MKCCKGVFPLGILLGLLSACATVSESDEADMASTTGAVSETVTLGMGYDVDMMQTKDKCIVGQPDTTKQTLTTWSFNHVEDVDSVKREMGFSAEGSFVYGIAKVTAKASFLRAVADTELTSTYLLMADYLTESAIMNGAKLTEAYKKESTSNKSSFRAKCGTDFVHKTESGGRLRVAAKFRFDNSSVRDKFNASGSFKAAKNGATLETNGLSEEEARGSSVEISVYQEGGNISSLQSIMDPQALVECNLDQWARCQDVLAKIIGYSQDAFPKDINSGNTRIYSYETQHYYEVPYEPLPANIEKIKTDSVKTMAAQENDRLIVTYLLKSRESTEVDVRKKELNNVNSLILRNLSKLSNNVISCVESPTNRDQCREVGALGLESYTQDQIEAGAKTRVGGAIGGSGGTPKDLKCSGYMAGVEARAGNILDQVRVVCTDGTSTDTVGGATGTLVPNTVCPSGQVVTGVRGRTEAQRKNQVVGSLTVYCGVLAKIRGGEVSSETAVPVFGSGEPGEVEWHCPAGYVGIGLSTRGGSYVDQLALVCTNVRHVERKAPVPSGSRSPKPNAP